MNGLRADIGLFWRIITNSYDVLLSLVLNNLYWFALTLLVLPAPFVAAGLYYSVNKLAVDDYDGWSTFFMGMRLYWLAGLRWFFINLTVIGIMVWDIVFFGQVNEGWALYIRAFILGVVLVWLIIQNYTFPFMLHQEKPSFRTALRNSAIFLVKWPFFSLFIAAVNLLLILLSIWLQFPLVFICGSLTAYFAASAIQVKDEEIQTI